MGMRDGGRARLAVSAVACVLVVLAAAQAVRWGFETAAYALVPHTLFTDGLVRTAAYAALFAGLVGLARRDGTRLRLLPARLGPGYASVLAVCVLLVAATPPLVGQACEPAAWAALACGAIATPLFEEALFRGYVWDRLKPLLGEGWPLVLATAVLFGLWHVGYADAVLWRAAQPDMLGGTVGVAGLMAGKAVFASGMGVVLGALRLKWGNCLAPGAFHAIWNVLA